MRADSRAHRFLPNGSRRVLVATEDVHLRRYVAEALSRAGYAADACGGDTPGILKRCGAEPPSLLIVDVKGESRTGSEVVFELRARGVQVPIVLLSGGASLEAAAPRPGVEHLSKPFTMETLELAIDRAFTRTYLDEMSLGIRDEPPHRSE